MNTLRIREVFKTVWETNPISGHSWPVHGATTAWEVVGPFGPVGRFKTEKRAEKELVNWTAFYNKFFPVVSV
jgi:hypothetical protein